MIGVRSGIDEYGQPAEEIISGYIGEFKYFGFSEVPPHCLACDGSEVSRETYNELFAVFGETFGAGDGATTFNLPDFRGAFLRCIGGNAAALGTEQGDAIRDISGSCVFRAQSSTAQETGRIILSTQGVFVSEAQIASEADALLGQGTVHATQQLNFAASRVVPTADEVRPIDYVRSQHLRSLRITLQTKSRKETIT